MDIKTFFFFIYYKLKNNEAFFSAGKQFLGSEIVTILTEISRSHTI